MSESNVTPNTPAAQAAAALPGASVAEVAVLAFAIRLLNNPYLTNTELPREVREFMVEYKELFADAPARELDEDFLSVRDEFAKAALQGELASQTDECSYASDSSRVALSIQMYAIADAMMEARKGGAR